MVDDEQSPVDAARRLTIAVDKAAPVSALLCAPAGAWAAYVVAHGAGAGMTHGFMAGFAQGLAGLGVATLRYQFPFMEAGSRRPDSPRLAQATVRAAVAAAAEHLAGLPLFAGGKSFGGRMTSQAQALAALPGVRGLVFVGFPLHAAGKPSTERAAHLFDVRLPMLFLQGTRDELAGLDLLQPLVQRIGERATLAVFNDADHGFHVRVRSGTTDALTLAAMRDTTAGWMRSQLAAGASASGQAAAAAQPPDAC